MRGYLKSENSLENNRQLAETLLLELGADDPMTLVNSVAEVAAAILQATSFIAATFSEQEFSAEQMLDGVENGLRMRKP